MRISHFHAPQPPLQPRMQGVPGDKPPESPKDKILKSMSTKEIVGRVLLFAVPTAAGVYAGLGTGWPAGVAGVLAAVPTCALIGGLTGGIVGEKLFHSTEANTVGAAIVGGIGGMAGGLALGVHCAVSAGGGAWAAVGMGLLGAGTGIMKASSWHPDN